MAKRIISSVYLIIAIYGVYVLINTIMLSNQTTVSVTNMIIFLVIFIVSFVGLALLYDLVLNDQIIRLPMLISAIVSLNYFIMGMFFRLVPTTNDTWAGPVNTLHLLFTRLDLSDATLIEYNLYYNTPMWVGILCFVFVGGYLIYRGKR